MKDKIKIEINHNQKPFNSQNITPAKNNQQIESMHQNISYSQKKKDFISRFEGKVSQISKDGHLGWY